MEIHLWILTIMVHMYLSLLASEILFLTTTRAHDFAPQQYVMKNLEEEATWLEKYGSQIDQPFSGPLAFSHLPYTRCLEQDEDFDIALVDSDTKLWRKLH